MASIDLPNSPTDGQTFTSGNATYTYIASKGYWDAVTTTAGIQLSSLSVGAEATAAGDGAIAYDNTTGVFTYTPPVVASASGIALTDISVGAEATASGDGGIAYDNSTGVFTYTPPAGGGGGIALTDISVGAEATASGDGAVAYDNTTGVFTYTPPVVGVPTSFTDITTFGTIAEKTSLPTFDIGSVFAEQAKIQASDAEASDGYGYSVSISSDGNTAIVGARGEDTGASNAGAAYIFVRSGTTWSQQAKIQASDLEADDWFGASVSISSDGNTAIVGAYKEDTGAANAGAAYIFVKSGTSWPQTQKIQASDLELSDQFGYSVSISSDGKIAIVGADLEDTGGTSAGAAYIFVAEISSIVSHDTTSNSLFVHSSVAANFTANFTNVPTTDDRTISVALIINQGATGYLPTAVQIDGVAQTILWQGAANPTANANDTDVASFTLFRSSGAWTVLGTVTQFGSV